jgi:hypothetical protein
VTIWVLRKNVASWGSRNRRKLSSKEMRQLFGLEKIRQTNLSHSHSPAAVEHSTALFYTINTRLTEYPADNGTEAGCFLCRKYL